MVSMNTCKTCRWWDRANEDTELGPPPEYDDVVIPHKPCLCPSVRDMSGRKAGKFADLPLDGAGYHDFGSYKAALRTGPDFGCVHHSPREPNVFVQMSAVTAPGTLQLELVDASKESERCT